MARIIITIPGPWGNDPAITTPFQLHVSPAEYEALVDIVAVGRKCEVLSDDQVGRLRKAPALLEAELAFEKPGDRAAAAAAVRLAADAFAAGAEAVFVETSLRVFGVETLKGAEFDDAHTLFHLFVEILMDDEAREVTTEGLQCFDLPDVVVPYEADDPEGESAAAAQAAAFSLAAQMVCDRLRPTSGGVFRASESAPWYRLKLEPADAALAAEDPFVNPRGRWALTPRKA
jgi:hypothetical protein